MGKIKILSEFKDFAMKGNVIDMAVGVIIGGAFSKIVSSLVNDIVMPALSIIIGRINFAELAVTVSAINKEGLPIEIKYGVFLQNILDFLVIAICIFSAVKAMNMLKKKYAEKPEVQANPDEKPAPAISKEEALLMEIRDILKDRTV